MPGRNKTGPEGMGPLTGRRMGICADAESYNYDFQPGLGRGLRRGFAGGGRGFSGRGRGMGSGFRSGFGFSGSQNDQNLSDRNAIENEIKMLRNQLSNLEDQLSKTDEK